MGGEGEDLGKTCRSVYLKRIRNRQDDFLSSLDQPAGFQSVPERQATTTATQSLLMVNGDWPLDRARSLATRLLNEKLTDDTKLVQRLYGLAYGRTASPGELSTALAFLKDQRAQLKREAPPPPPVVSPLADAGKLFGPVAKTTKAMQMRPGTPNEKLRVNLNGRLEPEQFAVEAVVMLKSLYPDASVRTIASCPTRSARF